MTRSWRWPRRRSAERADHAPRGERRRFGARSRVGRARVRAARPLPRERHRAVPRVRRRRRHRARRRAPLRAAGARRRPRRDLLLAALPGGARAPRARLLGVLLLQPLRARPARSGCMWARARRTSARRWPSSRPSSSAAWRTPPARRSSSARARTSRDGWCSALESTGARMSRLGASVLNDLPILSVDEVIERIDAVGIDDLRELARELFSAEAAVGRRRRPRRGGRSRRRSSRSRAAARQPAAGGRR